jgi:hypothetical protein
MTRLTSNQLREQPVEKLQALLAVAKGNRAAMIRRELKRRQQPVPSCHCETLRLH